MRAEVVDRILRNVNIENILTVPFSDNYESYFDVKFQDELAEGEIKCFPLGPVKKHLDGSVSQVVRFELETSEKTVQFYGELKKRKGVTNERVDA